MKTEQNPVVESKPAKTVVLLGVFSSAWARFQTAAYGDLKRMGCPEQLAHKIAMDFGPDIANAVLNSDTVAAKVSKANKEGLSKIDLKAKGETHLTNSMSIIRVVQQLAAMRQEGLIENCPALFDTIEWTNNIRAYIAKSQQWVSENEFKG